MVNQECLTLLEEAALESLAPDIAVIQEGYIQADPRQEVATEADNVAEDTMPSSHQYAALTDTGGWKMHEPSPLWTDGILPQQCTSPPPVDNLPRWQALTSEYNQLEIPIAESLTLNVSQLREPVRGE